MADAGEEWTVVPVAEVRTFIKRCAEVAGADPGQADSLADVLTTADQRGHYSHGINRLELYIRDVKDGLVRRSGIPQVLKETPAAAWVDGNNLLGPTVGCFCMQLAMDKAQKVGVGLVAVKGSNHFGIAGYYSLMASNKNLIGMAFTNTSPCMVPTRAKQRHLGTNPISMAARSEDDSFELDMATTTVALGKVEIAAKKHVPIPPTWGCDNEGQACTDPAKVHAEGGLMPLGGTEEMGGYKGAGLAFMVEILCGVLAGATYGPHVRWWSMAEEQAGDLGHCFLAIDPKFFAPGFEDRLTDLIDTTRNLEPSTSTSKVMIAGDPEKLSMRRCDQLGGIPYHPNILATMSTVARRLGIEGIGRV